MSRPTLDSSGLTQPSGSDVSKVESDIYQTISLADTVITLVREPIALLYNNINKTKKLKQSLGAWQTEALDKNGQPRIPVLRLLEFENHLVSTEGKVEYLPQVERPVSLFGKFRNFYVSGGPPSPGPQSNSSPEIPEAGAACWNYFLYALGIHPGMSITSWRPSMDGYINTQNGGVEMEIDGSVLCHIMNLYSTQPEHSPWARDHDTDYEDRRETRTCTFPFGELAWSSVNGQIHAHFKPGLEKELAGTKIPFWKASSKLEPGTVIASYLMAMTGSVSYTTFQLPKPSAPLSERIDQLLECFHALWRSTSTSIPIIICRDWFEEAARIKRRILADGGNDESFYDDIHAAIEKTEIPVAYWKEETQELLRENFLFGHETFEFYLEGSSQDSVRTQYDGLNDLVKGVVESYQDQPPGSWKRSLFDMKEKAIEVLWLGRRVRLKESIILLDFTRSCELWNQQVLLGAPVLE